VKPPISFPSRAFSLVELLVVVAVIAVLVVAGATMLGGNSARGTSVQGAVETGISLVELAKRSAQASQRKARIVINDNPQSEGYLRQMTVAVAGDTAGTSWNAVGRPLILPRGSFLHPELALGFRKDSFDFRTGGFGSGGAARYLEFDVVGHLLPDAGGAASAQLVFAAGIPATAAPFTPEFPDALSKIRDGFIIRRSGAIVRFEDPPSMQP